MFHILNDGNSWVAATVLTVVLSTHMVAVDGTMLPRELNPLFVTAPLESPLPLYRKLLTWYACLLLLTLEEMFLDQ